MHLNDPWCPVSHTSNILANIFLQKENKSKYWEALMDDDELGLREMIGKASYQLQIVLMSELVTS